VCFPLPASFSIYWPTHREQTYLPFSCFRSCLPNHQCRPVPLHASLFLPSIHLPAHLPIPHFHASIHVSTSPSRCITFYKSIHLYACISVCLLAFLLICQPICLSVSVYLFPYITSTFCLHIHLFMRLQATKYI
jgi:hypothetical protein